MENTEKREAPAPPQPAPTQRIEKATQLTVTSTALNKVQFAIMVEGKLETITLLPNGATKLPDTAEVRKALQPIITQNHIKIS